eukprot:83558-Amphidinium_carterae.1
MSVTKATPARKKTRSNRRRKPHNNTLSQQVHRGATYAGDSAQALLPMWQARLDFQHGWPQHACTT